MNFQKIVVDTDQGLIFEDLESETFFAFENSWTDKVHYDSHFGFAYVDIVSSLNTHINKRVYPKIQDIAARVSGSFKLLFMIGALFTASHTKYSIYGTCITSLYNYKYDGFVKFDKYMQQQQRQKGGFKSLSFSVAKKKEKLGSDAAANGSFGVNRNYGADNKCFEDKLDHYYAAQTSTCEDNYFGIGHSQESFEEAADVVLKNANNLLNAKKSRLDNNDGSNNNINGDNDIKKKNKKNIRNSKILNPLTT